MVDPSRCHWAARGCSTATNSSVDAKDAEYQGLYRRFIDLTSGARSDVDLAPQLLVADAFMLGQRHVVDAFEDKT